MGTHWLKVRCWHTNVLYLFTGIKCQLASLPKILVLKGGLWIETAIVP